jgi:hypothetical protein
MIGKPGSQSVAGKFWRNFPGFISVSDLRDAGVKVHLRLVRHCSQLLPALAGEKQIARLSTTSVCWWRHGDPSQPFQTSATSRERAGADGPVSAIAAQLEPGRTRTAPSGLPTLARTSIR